MEKELRTQIVAALVDQTDAGPRVFPNRWKPFSGADFPVICVYTVDSPAKNLPGNLAEERVSGVEVLLWTKGSHTPATPEESADFQSDDLRSQVEGIMNASPAGGWPLERIRFVEYKGFKIPNKKEMGEGEELILPCHMRYDFSWIYDPEDV